MSINFDFGLNKEILFPIHLYHFFLSVFFFFHLKNCSVWPMLLIHLCLSLELIKFSLIPVGSCVFGKKRIIPKANQGQTNYSLGLILANFPLCMFLIRILYKWQNTKHAARKMINNIIFCSITSLITTQ